MLALAADTEKLARAKVEAVHRHQNILEYSERVRQEYMAEVDACIAEALIKAERAHAGEALSSSESEAEEELNEESEEPSTEDNTDQDLFLDDPTPLAAEPEQAQSYVGVKSMSTVYRNPREIPAIEKINQRRSSSQAVSTGSSSPAECPTPKSHKGNQVSQPSPSQAVAQCTSKMPTTAMVVCTLRRSFPVAGGLNHLPQFQKSALFARQARESGSDEACICMAWVLHHHTAITRQDAILRLHLRHYA